MRKPTIIATLALTTALALTGCTNTSTPLPEDSTSGSPTPSYTTTPQTEDEAIAGAKAGANDWWRIAGETVTTHPSETTELMKRTTENATKGAQGIVSMWTENKLQGSGAWTFTPSSSGAYASPANVDGADVPYGFVSLPGCLVADFNGTFPDGRPVEWNGLMGGSHSVQMKMQWSPKESVWQNYDIVDNGQECTA